MAYTAVSQEIVPLHLMPSIRKMHGTLQHLRHILDFLVQEYATENSLTASDTNSNIFCEATNMGFKYQKSVKYKFEAVTNCLSRRIKIP